MDEQDTKTQTTTDESGTKEEVEVQVPTEPKKRVLTEAQRLAFLKGREKRMLNIQKKKEEKEEMMKSKKAEITKQEPTEEVKPASVDIDEDGHAKKVADYVYKKIMGGFEPPEAVVQPPKRTRKPRTSKTSNSKGENEKAELPPAPPQKIISWC
jgi:hypothetical protein